MSDMYSQPPKPAGAGSSVLTILLVVLAVIVVGMLACGGLLAALLIPAVSAARTAAKRAQSMNNMKMIGLALHNYHDTYNKFPTPYWTKDGKRMHSWRTAILPFMEASPLFEQYDFNVPWDDPANATVIGTDLPYFHSPNDPNPIPGGTSYLLLTGPNAVMVPDKWTGFRDVLDGTSNTVIMIEVIGSTTRWAEPDDLDAETYQLPPDGVNALFADGSVRKIENITPEQFKALLTRAGGESFALPY